MASTATTPTIAQVIQLDELAAVGETDCGVDAEGVVPLTRFVMPVATGRSGVTVLARPVASVPRELKMLSIIFGRLGPA